MIIWLNGAFGVGKTSVAQELVRLVPGSRLTDPERIGYVMKRTLWRGGDYQEVALWRQLVRWQVTRRGRSGVTVVPMTVVRRDVFEELTDGARVFLLTATRSTLEERISRSGEAQDWRRQNLDRCLDAFETGDYGERTPTDERSPGEIARTIIERL